MDNRSQLRAIAFIPARSGSKRVPDKNVRILGGHPMMAYTIAAALRSEVFQSVVVSTDSEEYAEIARHYGAEVPFLRPTEFASDVSPDIEWVEYTLASLKSRRREYDCFSILRPTSPFRRTSTIQRAWQLFVAETGVDSLRAVEKCKQHPGKMWVVRGSRMVPLLPLSPTEQPWHSSQYAALPEVFVQNSSLEIAWTRVVFEDRSIAGQVLMPFFTSDVEGFDINHEQDWLFAETMVRDDPGSLPAVSQTPYFSKSTTT